MEKDVQAVRRATLVGLVVNVALVVAKLAAGWLGNSQAVVADGVHSLSDLVTDVALLLGLRYWSRPADEDHPHGHGRLENLVAAAVALALAVAGIQIGWNAAGSLLGPVPEAPTFLPLVAALLSIVSKEALFRWTRKVGERTGSRALVVNAWHHRSDAASSIPAALGVGLGLADHRLWLADPIAAIVVAGFVLWAAWRLLLPELKVLTDAAAPQAVVRELEARARAVSGVRDVHSVRTRQVGTKFHVDLHVTVDPEMSVRQGHEVAETVSSALKEAGLGVQDVVVHLEPDEPHAS